MHTLSRTTRSRKGVVMVLDTAKPKNRKSIIWPGMRGRDAAKRVDSQGEHFTSIHDRFLRDPILYPQSEGQNKSARRWTNLQKKTTRTISLQRNSKDTKDNGISNWTSLAKMGLCDFDPIFELLSLSQKPSPPGVRRTSCTAYFSKTIEEMASFKSEWDWWSS